MNSDMTTRYLYAKLILLQNPPFQNRSARCARYAVQIKYKTPSKIKVPITRTVLMKNPDNADGAFGCRPTRSLRFACPSRAF